MEIVSGIGIECDENIKDGSAKEYLDIIKSVLNDIEKSNNVIINSGIVPLIQLESDIKWKDNNYDGFLYHMDSRIEIKVELGEVDYHKKLNFREVLHHELSHAIFRNNFIIRRKRNIYNNQSLGLVYIDEYLAYYNTYRYVVNYDSSECYKKHRLKEHEKSCKNTIKLISNKYNDLLKDIINNEKDFYQLINCIAKYMALLQVKNKEFIDGMYFLYPYMKEIPISFNFDNIEEEINKCDETMYKYLFNFKYIH